MKRRNPSICKNDNKYSAIPYVEGGSTRGACNRAGGIDRFVDGNEYTNLVSKDFSKQRDEAIKRSKEKIEERFKIKTLKKIDSYYEKLKQIEEQSTKKTVVENVKFEVDKNSFNEQYKDLQYKDNDVLKIAIALTLEEWDVLSVGSHKSFLDKNNLATLTDLKTIATNDLLPFIEEQAKSKEELGVLISDYFEMVAKNIPKANKIILDEQKIVDEQNNILRIGSEVYEKDSKYVEIMAQVLMSPYHDNQAKKIWNLYKNFAIEYDFSLKDMKAFMSAYDNGDHNAVLGYAPQTKEDLLYIAQKQFPEYHFESANDLSVINLGSRTEFYDFMSPDSKVAQLLLKQTDIHKSLRSPLKIQVEHPTYKMVIESALLNGFNLIYTKDPQSNAKKPPKVYIIQKGQNASVLGTGSTANGMYAKYMYEKFAPERIIKE